MTLALMITFMIDFFFLKCCFKAGFQVTQPGLVVTADLRMASDCWSPINGGIKGLCHHPRLWQVSPNLFPLHLFVCLFVCTFTPVQTCMQAPQCVEVRGQFSPVSRWAVGIGVRLVGLVASPSTCWASRCPLLYCCLRLANAVMFTQQLWTCAISLVSFSLDFFSGCSFGFCHIPSIWHQNVFQLFNFFTLIPLSLVYPVKNSF